MLNHMDDYCNILLSEQSQKPKVHAKVFSFYYIKKRADSAFRVIPDPKREREMKHFIT